MFLNGPANHGYNWHRWRFYGGSGGTPTVKIDGFGSSTSSSAYTRTINTRLAVPTDLAISTSIVGDATSGKMVVDLTAEKALPAGSLVLCAGIVEDHEIATPAWGGYKTQEMMWIPVSFMVGDISFNGSSYPQTIRLTGNYTLDPAKHPVENLNVVTFVQLKDGTKEVLNANYMSFPNSTSLSENDIVSEVANSVLCVGPNPTTGAFSISSSVPSGATGTVEIFDISGRMVEKFDAGSIENKYLEETGVYFVILSSSTGEVVREQIAVIR